MATQHVLLITSVLLMFVYTQAAPKEQRSREELEFLLQRAKGLIDQIETAYLGRDDPNGWPNVKREKDGPKPETSEEKRVWVWIPEKEQYEWVENEILEDAHIPSKRMWVWIPEEGQYQWVPNEPPVAERQILEDDQVPALKKRMWVWIPEKGQYDWVENAEWSRPERSFDEEIRPERTYDESLEDGGRPQRTELEDGERPMRVLEKTRYWIVEGPRPERDFEEKTLNDGNRTPPLHASPDEGSVPEPAPADASKTNDDTNVSLRDVLNYLKALQASKKQE